MDFFTCSRKRPPLVALDNRNRGPHEATFTSDASTGANTSIRALCLVKTNATQAQAQEKEKF